MVPEAVHTHRALQHLRHARRGKPRGIRVPEAVAGEPSAPARRSAAAWARGEVFAAPATAALFHRRSQPHLSAGLPHLRARSATSGRRGATTRPGGTVNEWTRRELLAAGVALGVAPLDSLRSLAAQQRPRSIADFFREFTDDWVRH